MFFILEHILFLKNWIKKMFRILLYIYITNLLDSTMEIIYEIEDIYKIQHYISMIEQI